MVITCLEIARLNALTAAAASGKGIGWLAGSEALGDLHDSNMMGPPALTGSFIASIVLRPST